MLLLILKVKKLLEGFTEKICKKEIKKSLELIEFIVEKVITRKGDKLYVTRKDYNVLLTVGLIKKT